MDVKKIQESIQHRMDIQNKILNLISEYKIIEADKGRYISNNPKCLENYGKDDSQIIKYRKRIKSIKKQITSRLSEIAL